MSIFPTNKTVPLDKDIAVAEAKALVLGTAPREQLSVVLDAIDNAIAQEITDRIADVNAEEAARIADVNAEEARAIAAETVLQNNINTEASIRAAADTTEATARFNEDTILQSEIDSERSPLKTTATGSNSIVQVASATQNRLGTNGTIQNQLAVPSGAYVSDFAGGSVNFNAGSIIYTNNPTPPNSTFTLPSLASKGSLFIKASIVLLPTSPDQLFITFSDQFASTALLAPSPAISGGVPVALVTLQVNSSETGFENILQTSLTQFIASGTGASSGSGSPLDPQSDETFIYYSRSDFSIDTKKFVASTTGTDNILGLKKVTLNSGQYLLTTDLTGPQFRADQIQINTAQARLMYNLGHVDLAPTVQFSNNGGLTWLSGTNYIVGSVSNLIESDAVFTQSSSPLFDGGTANATLSSARQVAAIFAPTFRTIMTGFAMKMQSTATIGTVVGKIYTVTSGIPQVLLATSAQTLEAGIDFTSTAAYINFNFNNIALEANTEYALVIEGTNLNANLSVNQVTTPPAFNHSSATGSGSWAASAVGLAFYAYGMGGDLRLKIISGTNGSELTGFGIEYVNESAAGTSGTASWERRILTTSEATTGLINLSAIRFTPGAHQLIVTVDNKIYMAPDFTELSSSQVQFPANTFTAGKALSFFNQYGLVDGSSLALGKMNLLYDAIVGSASQVASGYATHASLSSAIASVSIGGNILILKGNYTENVIVQKQCTIEGQGAATTIAGNISFNSNADYCKFTKLRVIGNVTLDVGADYNDLSVFWINSTGVVTDNGSSNYILGIRD